ncbi:uncharacterized protein LOC128261001 [Drosophila gunungcola]|uniref:Zinc metalloproteinase YIL108W n=1 Tax=Drosophila gunungcola TaxID=103775 RepID=A0A9Q0BJR7_9MUSC|nr:uncharacterized protein LOC128261001 [Drosophila gunungcola]KAI8035072.1 hypothetical protein M5D96_012165 [Drosophila gunungcola]
MSSGTAGCKRVHSIEVEQPLEAERVEHGILLVKGRLQPKCSTARQLKATLDLPEHQSSEQLTQLSAAGEFKLLFDLERGDSNTNSNPNPNTNTDLDPEEIACLLELRSCSAARLIRFKYKPRRSSYRVQPLYVLCRDEERPEEQLCQLHSLIDLNLRLVQSIYAHKLQAAGFPNRTFTLNGACCSFRSQLTRAEALARSEEALWQHFAGEIIACPQWGHQLLLKFVAFVGCTHYDGDGVAASGDSSYANIRRHLKGHAALGGGGLALFGSAHFYAWPTSFSEIGDCVRSTERVDTARLPDESNYRRTYGGVYASTLGAVCHELGHCFDLGHTTEGVMGQGFDYLNRVLTVDQPTEHLPQRIVAARRAAAGPSSEASGGQQRPRFTKLKLQPGSSSQLLDNYHNQRRHDSFYFGRNCAVILAHHRWLNPEFEHTAAASFEAAHIQLSRATKEIVSSRPLRLVELRCNQNSLVAHYEEFGEQEAPVHRFQLPASLWHLLAEQRTHYVFVLTTSGDTKRLSCDS